MGPKQPAVSCRPRRETSWRAFVFSHLAVNRLFKGSSDFSGE